MTKGGFQGHLGLHALAKKRQWRCAYCDRKTHCLACNPQLGRELAATRDHHQPKSKGGANGARNLVLACFDCNQDKADTVPDSRLVPSTPKRAHRRRRAA